MKKILMLLSLTVLLAGCASNSDNHANPSPSFFLPTVTDANRAAEVIYIRGGGTLAGSAFDIGLRLDGKEMFRMPTGKYTRFSIDPGQYEFSAYCFGGWSPTMKKAAKTVNLQPGEKYYLLLHGRGGFQMEHLSESQAQEQIAKNKFKEVKVP